MEYRSQIIEEHFAGGRRVQYKYVIRGEERVHTRLEAVRRAIDIYCDEIAEVSIGFQDTLTSPPYITHFIRKPSQLYARRKSGFGGISPHLVVF